ncbi:transmembrane protein, putative [Medicago truncatula]|uniref:Transmembrane protein, putative n=1 Tax=Medicago truncatula TaxID=3880 RepID=G7IYL9_MEDTR|nr:transmembrane protein, putative [Medicago truncatula]
MPLGGKNPLLIESLEEVASCKTTQGVPPLACFNSRAFLKSLTFAWTALSGFQSTGSIFLFVPLIFAWTALSGFQSTGTLSIA